jgi:Spy/CpxP family protein refolding chaperone
MKTQKTILAASVVALGLLSYPVLSQAFDGVQSQRSGQHCRHSGNDMARHSWGHLVDRLNLSKEQRQSMNAIDDKYRPPLRDLRQLLQDNRQALAKMDATDAKLPEVAAAQGKAIADLIVARKNMRSEMDKVLTEEQRQTLDKLFEQRGHHRHQHEDMNQG